MKKYIFTFIAILSSIHQDVFAQWTEPVAQWTKPVINCQGLPWCGEKWTENAIETVWINIIALIIQYVAVFAVIALMLSGVMYMISSWEEEKTKKAKTWIIWSVVAVALSISAYFIVNILNNINIT